MSGAIGAKRCAGQLRYAQFADWHAPVSFYLVEKVEASMKKSSSRKITSISDVMEARRRFLTRLSAMPCQAPA